MKSFLTMLSFFTRIPLRIRFEVNSEVYQKGIKYLIIIALIIGAPVGAAFLLKEWLGPYVAAFISLTLYLLITGGLHVDGMADTMDAFGSNRDREKMLAIMKDSRIGTFGVLAICIYVAGMVLLMAQADAAAIVLFPLAGRTAALLCARMFGYARPEGLGKCFVDGAKTSYVLAAALVYIAIAFLFCFGFQTVDTGRLLVLVSCSPVFTMGCWLMQVP